MYHTSTRAEIWCAFTYLGDPDGKNQLVLALSLFHYSTTFFDLRPAYTPANYPCPPKLLILPSGHLWSLFMYGQGVAEHV